MTTTLNIFTNGEKRVLDLRFKRRLLAFAASTQIIVLIGIDTQTLPLTFIKVKLFFFVWQTFFVCLACALAAKARNLGSIPRPNSRFCYEKCSKS